MHFHPLVFLTYTKEQTETTGITGTREYWLIQQAKAPGHAGCPTGYVGCGSGTSGGMYSTVGPTLSPNGTEDLVI